MKKLAIYTAILGLGFSHAWAQFAPAALSIGDKVTLQGTYKEDGFAENTTVLIFTIQAGGQASGIADGQPVTASYTYNKSSGGTGNNATFTYNYTFSATGYSYTENATQTVVFTSTTTGTYSGNGNYTENDAGKTFSGTFTNKGNFTYTPASTVNPPAGAPSNDNFANATLIPSTLTTATGNNTNATRETGETLYNDIDTTLVANANGTFSEDGQVLSNSTYTKLSATTAKLSVEFVDTESNYSLTSKVTFNLTFTSRTTGTITVGGDYNEKIGTNPASTGAITGSGTFDLLFPSPSSLVGDLASTSLPGGTVVNLMGSLSNFAPANGAQTIWYKWVAPASGTVEVKTAGSTLDTVLTVLSGSQLSNLILVGVNDDYNDDALYASRVQFSATTGQTYYFAVDGYRNNGKTETGAVSIAVNYSVPAYFPAAAYLNANPDLKSAFSGSSNSASRAWEHYLTSGVNENRGDGTGFTAQAYLARYSDLRGAFGSNLAAAATHWYTFGRAEGRMTPTGFAAAEYLKRNPDVAAAVGKPDGTADLYSAWLHYKDFGAAEGRVYSDNFQPRIYLALNPDLAKAFGATNTDAAIEHWENFGKKEGRWGSVPTNFSVSGYLTKYTDLAAAFGGNAKLPATAAAAYTHYIDFGAKEGRSFDETFRALEYLSLHSDLKTAFGTDASMAAVHWLRYGQAEKRLGRVPTTFEAQTYVNKYTDLKNAYGADATQVSTKVNAWLHYTVSGAKEGRTLDASFNPTNYLNRYSDLKAAFGTDLGKAAVHWFIFGKGEGRTGN